MADGYVTNWGNDTNDGLTWETAKRTFQGAKDVALDPVYAKGWFNETANNKMTGEGEFISFGYNLPYAVLDIVCKFENITFKNFNRLFYRGDYGNNISKNCVFENIEYLFVYYSTDLSWALRNIQYSIFNNVGNCKIGGISTYQNNTQHLCSSRSYYRHKNEIISKTEIEYLAKLYDEYSLFISTKFQFIGGGLGTDETTYTYPTGADDNAKLQNLKDRMAVVYGGIANDYLIGCKYYSRNAPDGQEETLPYSEAYKDIFIDADNGDFHLIPGCIAANMAYDGSYIGAKPVGSYAKWNADWINLVNIDTQGRVIDQEQDATAESNIIDIGVVSQITEINNLNYRASRNGQQINTESNLSTPIAAGANVLTDAKTYMCIDAVITLDDAASISYNPWDTFVAVDEGSGAGLGFSTSTNGRLQEVLIDKYDQKSTYKFSKDDATLATANTITLFDNEIPKVNLDVNGIPTNGNADSGFDPLTAVDLYARYWKKFLIVKANNLPAR